MNKFRSSFALLFALFLLSIASTHLVAQTEMRWDTHGVGFTVPDDFKVSTNDAEEYTAANDHLMLTIAPIQDEEITQENLAEAVLAMATAMEYESLDEADKIDVHDFTGYYIKGTRDGINAVVIALLDKESSTNLLVVIAYDDDYFDEAVAIASSFFAYD
ncbi:MAG: hypothetical protein Q7T20_05730 [Saprospiraceae bacterium]|nr:hypothetical protein [Saprospiraceae bacterium]